MKNGLIYCIVLLASFTGLMAEEFDLKDPKNVNNISFYLDSDLEPFGGTALGISGKVQFDAEKKSLSGTVELEVSSVKVPNEMMTKYMLGEMWLDAEKHPKITVAFDKVVSCDQKDNVYHFVVSSKVQIKGIEKVMELHVAATYLPNKLGDRVQKKTGDLLVLRSEFVIKRSDFNISPDKHLDKVANDIKITANLAGHLFKE